MIGQHLVVTWQSTHAASPFHGQVTGHGYNALTSGVSVLNTMDIDEDSHCNTEGTTDSLFPSEGPLGHLSQQTTDD